MSALPPCPEYKSEYAYEGGGLMFCPISVPGSIHLVDSDHDIRVGSVSARRAKRH
ncbi:hypothetical protein H0A65_12085 [Alcaligenaceae bacterium]|nr:hypothetical protein [Alcaligenaceae bacterium]